MEKEVLLAETLCRLDDLDSGLLILLKNKKLTGYYDDVAYQNGKKVRNVASL